MTGGLYIRHIFLYDLKKKTFNFLGRF